jgi:1,4-dihydroxy-2-naphthoyl-CoA synthase
MQAVKLFYESPEAKEGVKAFREKRPPRFRS